MTPSRLGSSFHSSGSWAADIDPLAHRQSAALPLDPIRNHFSVYDKLQVEHFLKAVQCMSSLAS